MPGTIGYWNVSIHGLSSESPAQPLKLRSAFGIADLIADLQSEFLDLGRHETCRPTFKTFSAFFAEWVHRYIVHWHKYTFSNQVFCIVLIALTLISFIKWWSLVEVRDVNRGSVIGNFWSKFALQIVDEKQDCWTEDLNNPCFPVFCHPFCHNQCSLYLTTCFRLAYMIRENNMADHPSEYCAYVFHVRQI